MAIVGRNTAFVLGVQALMKIIALLFSVYIVRRLGDVHFGRYSAVIAYVTIFAILTDLGMAPYAVREMAEDRRRTSNLLGNIIAVRVLLSCLIIIVAPLSAYWLGKESDMVLGIFIASVGLLLYAVQGPFSTALVARERLDYDATFSLFNKLVFWGLGALLLVWGLGFIGLIIASLAGVAVVILLSGWALTHGLGVGRFTVSVHRWLPLVRASLPFGVSGISYVFMDRFDTVLMSFALTDAAVGWYNVSSNLVFMVLLIAQSVAQALYPSMVREHAANADSLRNIVPRAMKYLLMICLPIAVGGTVLADRIVILLYTEQFAPSIPVLRILLWALPSLFLLELLGRVVSTRHLERPAARINVISAIVTVLLNLVLVPTLGVIGAALAFLVARAIRLVQLWFLVGNDQLVATHWQSLGRLTLAAGLMGLAVFFLRNGSLFLAIAFGAGLYLGLLLLFRVVDQAELAAVVQLMSGTNRAQKGV